MAVEIIPCAPGQSLFHILDKYWSAKIFGRAVHRGCTLLRKMHARTIIVEDKDSIDGILRERLLSEKKALKLRLGYEPEVSIFRLTFVSSSIAYTHEIRTVENDEFLGYITILNLNLDNAYHSYIFDSIIREPGFFEKDAGRAKWVPLQSSYVHVKRLFHCQVSDRTGGYDMQGSFFCQQNSITSVCAHASAAMVINNHSSSNKLVTCEDINAAIGIDHDRVRLRAQLPAATKDKVQNRETDKTGLDNSEVIAAFDKFGICAREHPCTLEGQQAFYRPLLYGAIESGWPALLAFSTGRGQQHVVAAIGHSLNSDSWLPVAFAQYTEPVPKERGHLSTLDWVPDFIVHDDNLGMFLSLPGHWLPFEESKPALSFRPLHIISICPRGGEDFAFAFDAEDVAFERLLALLREIQRRSKEGVSKPPFYAKNYYTSVLIKHLANHTAIFRAVLIKPSDYHKHLLKADYEGNELSCEDHEIIWSLIGAHKDIFLVEITIPDLYVGNKSKIADILIAARPLGSTECGWNDVILMRLPDALLKPTPYSGPLPFAVLQELAVGSHIKLFSFQENRPEISTW